MNENEFYIKFWTAILSTFIATIVVVNIDDYFDNKADSEDAAIKANAMVRMVEAGSTPIAARCAIHGLRSAVICNNTLSR